MPLLSGLILVTAWISFAWLYPTLENDPIHSYDKGADLSIRQVRHFENKALPTHLENKLATDYKPKVVDKTEGPAPWRTVKVQKGDNMSLIFKRIKQSPAVLHAIMSTGNHSEKLMQLMPGDEINYQVLDNQLMVLRVDPEPGTTLLFEKIPDGFTSQKIITELTTTTRDVQGVITDSLFLAGQQAGLSDNLIMRLVEIYGWDIDFALEIRNGDHFRVLYEEQFLDGEKVRDGNILVAEFVNKGKSYRAVRYTNPEGETGFFNEQGYSMRKAFLRTPVKFNRISSLFNPNRKHPILNTIRAHKGVDYAAPTGTPVKATGDGTVMSAGRNDGYGNAVIIRHAGTYETLYAHLSRFANGMTRGKHVRQGDIIGYVGQTGLASGPHLHYEFRINGVHRNPLTVELPKALPIPDKYRQHFQSQTGTLIAKLNSSVPATIASKDSPDQDNLILALKEKDRHSTTVH
ncbi:MAG: peptidase M23 [Gammaproteobacteria bacterium]|nr:MAG: peptidase M23 [Gammaproteobacteria bacterium]